MDLEQPKREHCAGIKANGERCGAWPVGDTDLCAGHSRLGIAADPATYASQGAAATALVRRKKREQRKMTLLDRLAAVIERDAEEIALELRSAGRGGDWRATEALITRVHGKPVERVEQVPASVDVRAMTPEQRAALMAKVLEENPGLTALVPRTALVQPDALTGMSTEDTG